MTTQRTEAAFRRASERLGLSLTDTRLFKDLYEPVAQWLADACHASAKPIFAGVNGAQGSGKSTFCALLAEMLIEGYGLNVVNLSIDDVYLTRAERLGLGETVHPLCAIRGVPGTHDVSLTHGLFDDLLAAGPGDVVPIPRFDKAVDDRIPEERWERAVGPVDLVFFEGWCVGCPVLPEWTGPYNAREAREDAQGRWAKWSDAHLSTDYQRLFGRLDFMLMLRVPSMETVRRGRWLQEQKLWARHEAAASDLKTLTGLMTKDEVMDYVALFERHTEHMLASLPDYCEVLISRDDSLQFALERLGAPRMSRAV